MSNLIAYHGDENLKASVLTEMAGHREADRLVKGVYWENGKGCAVGCLIKSGNHAEYENKFGIPQALARLEDQIFEGLPDNEAQQWPERFLGAITAGADLTMTVSKLMLWLLEDPDGIKKHALPATLIIIGKIAEMYRLRIAGKDPARADWLKVRKAADAAADAAAAYAAAYAAAAAAAAADAADAYAAYAAAAAAADAADAYAAAYAAAAAADAADAAAYAARRNYFSRIAGKLIEILSDSK